MFDKFIPQIITDEEYAQMTGRQRRINRPSTPEQITDVQARREREARRQAFAAPYIAAGGQPWSPMSENADIARVYFNDPDGFRGSNALGYVDVDTGEFVSTKAAVSHAEFKAKIQALLK